MKTHFKSGQIIPNKIEKKLTKDELKDTYINLTIGESVKVCLLTKEEILVINTHQPKKLKIDMQYCLYEFATVCPLCKTSEHSKDIEIQKDLRREIYYSIAMGIIGTTNVKLLYGSRVELTHILSIMGLNAPPLPNLVYKLKRNKYQYTLSPVYKLKDIELTSLEYFKSIELNDQWYRERLVHKSIDEVLLDLKKAGYPTDLLTFFDE